MRIFGGPALHCYRSIDEAVDDVLPRHGALKTGHWIGFSSEIVMHAVDDPAYYDIAANADYAFIDGIGVAMALRLTHAISPRRSPGCEVWEGLMKRAGEMDVSVFLIGSKREVVEKTAIKLQADYKTPIVGYQDGYIKPDAWPEVIDRIVALRPRIVAVAMGVPKQDEFIVACKKRYPNAYYLGVGGSFDVYAGHVRRAPAWIGNLGFEWLFRLILEPKRAGRQLALPRFAWWVLRRRALTKPKAAW